MIEQHIISLADGKFINQDVLVMEGGVAGKQKENLKKFNEDTKTILAGINPRTAVN